MTWEGGGIFWALSFFLTVGPFLPAAAQQQVEDSESDDGNPVEIGGMFDDLSD